MSKESLLVLRAKKDILSNDKKILSWFGKIKAKPNTQRNYLLAMQYYTDYMQQFPQELLEDAFSEIHAGKLLGERKYGDDITAFRQHLIDHHGMEENTVRVNMNAIISFYSANSIELPDFGKMMRKVRPLVENRVKLTREDIQSALTGREPLERAIVLVGVASGLSMNEIRHLKIRDVRNINPKTGITRIELVREKTDVEFTTFLTKEAGLAVKDYLAWRSRTSKTSRRSALAKQAITSDSGYLFIKRHVPGEWLKTHNEELRHIDHDAFLLIYRVIAEKCGKLGDKGKMNPIRSHNIRRFFYSELLGAHCDSVYIEHWMGHAMDTTKDAYAIFDPKKAESIYEKYEKVLTINPETDAEILSKYEAEIKEREALVEEIKQLKEDNIRLAVEKSEVEKLSEDFKDFHNRLEKIKFGREAKKEFDWIGLKKP